MKHLTGIAAALALLLGGAAQARAEMLYATSQLGSQIGIWKVDTAANTSSLLFRTQQVPDSLIFTTDGNILYSALDVGQVRLFNTTTHVDRLVASGLGVPLDLALDPGGKSVLVSNIDGSISRINLTTLAVGTRNFPGNNPEGITYDNQGRLFANLGTRAAGGSILAQLNPSDASILKEKTGLSGLDGLTFDSFTGKLYATDELNDRIDVIDPNTLAVTVLSNSHIPVPDGIESDGRGNLYIAAFNANVYTYDLTTGTLTKGPSVPGLDDLAPLAGLGAPPVPEPASLTLLSIGGIALVMGWRLHRRGTRLAQV
jgi:DNA-binding beta-propeller fold protein YncE